MFALENRQDDKRSRLINNLGPPLTLSVTTGGEILMPSCFDASLRVFDAKGIKFKTFVLPLKVQFPQHAVETRDKTYIVSCKQTSSPQNLHQLLELSADGAVIRDFSVDNLDRPLHIALFENGGIILTDNTNHKIIVIDSQMKWQRTLLCKHLII